ncbi:MAG: 4a-hydroxytetrahydrobiopterin dehydratase [Marinobacter sp.]|nr:4a-hydroxytetrahydrobiopterin dehydratase [Marinobacter sp.]
MTKLKAETCEACRPDAPRVTGTELQTLLAEVPDWSLVEEGGVQQLQRVIKLANFVEALKLANDIGGMAEAVGHHPALLVEWGRLTVRWWSHEMGGLHRNDFILAARTDDLVAKD